jgi:hypothetical protein
MPTLVSPPAGSTLSGFTTTFVFSAPGALNCTAEVGSTQGGFDYDYFDSVPCGQVVGANIPTNSSTVWVAVWAHYSGGVTMGRVDFKFTAGAPIPLPSPSTTGACNTIGAVTGLPYCAYAPSSPWNQPLPANPAIDPNSLAKITGVMQNYPQNGAFQINDSTWSAFPVYTTKAGDPTVTVTNSLGYGNLAGQVVPIPGSTTLVTGPQGDAHLTVLNPANGLEYDYYEFPQGYTPTAGGKLTVGASGVTNYQTGTGWGEVTTAAGAALLGGLVTVDEFMSGTIHHALAIAPACNNGFDVTPQMPAVYPATSNASFNCPVSKGNGIPHGSRIWSDLTDAQVDALNLDKISSILLKALYHYGGFVTDTNGMVGLDVRNIMESPITATGMTWWNQNGGLAPGVPAINKQPVSFFTAHFHVLQPCVTQGNCPVPSPSPSASQ